MCAGISVCSDDELETFKDAPDEDAGAGGKDEEDNEDYETDDEEALQVRERKQASKQAGSSGRPTSTEAKWPAEGYYDMDKRWVHQHVGGRAAVHGGSVVLMTISYSVLHWVGESCLGDCFVWLGLLCSVYPGPYISSSPALLPECCPGAQYTEPYFCAPGPQGPSVLQCRACMLVGADLPGLPRPPLSGRHVTHADGGHQCGVRWRPPQGPLTHCLPGQVSTEEAQGGGVCRSWGRWCCQHLLDYRGRRGVLC